MKKIRKWMMGVMLLSLFAVAGTVFFLAVRAGYRESAREYGAATKAEGHPEGEEKDSEGNAGEGSPENGSTQEASDRDDREDIVSDPLQFPRIIHSELTQSIDYVFLSEEIYCVYDGNAWLYITQEGAALTPGTYTYAYPFHEGLACVCKEGKYGFIDTEGRTVIDFVYDRATPFVEGLAYFCGDDGYGFMDRTGTPVFYLDCDSASAFQEGLAFISVDGKYGYIDRTGQIVIQPIYDYADYFQGGFAEIWRDNKRGIIDSMGREILAPEYVEIERAGDCFIGERNGKYTIFDGEGNTLLEKPCDGVSIYRGEIELCYAHEGRTGFIHEGEAVLFDIPYSFKTVLHDRELVVAKQDELWGVIDFWGEVKVPFCYNSITYDEGAEVFIVSDAEFKDGVIDADDFSQRVMCGYDDIGSFVNGQAVIRMEDKYGTIDSAGNPVLPIVYDEIGLLENGSYWYKEDGKSYLYDAGGTLLNVGYYDNISLMGNCYRVRKNYRDTGFLNAAGKEVLAPDCHEASGGNYYGYSGSQSEYAVLYSRDYGDGYTIVSTQGGESGSGELPAIFLLNEITPRVSAFWELVRNGSFYVDNMGDLNPRTEVFFSEWNFARSIYRIYDFGHMGRAVLYVYSEPYNQSGPRTMSYSGFFTAQGEDAVCLLSGYECGGTAGGNYMCLWYDNEEEKLLLGECGYAGGFGGNASYGSIYDYAEGTIAARVSFEWIGQSSGNYSKEELIENAELYYHGNDQPYTRETILDAEDIEEYSVDGELTTVERYREVRERYRQMGLPD